MGSVNLVVIVESVRVIITHGDGSTNKFHLASILAVAAALGKPRKYSVFRTLELSN